jgi:hypothetical protein
MRHFSMKNAMLALVIGLVLGTSGGAVLAADLQTAHIGSRCDGSGLWHFVNNQIGTATTGLLQAQFSCGDFTNVTPSHVTPGTIHFEILTDGDCTLEGASTNLSGKLVLSDLDCEAKKCVPEKEICGDKIDNDCDGTTDESECGTP